MKQTGLIIKAPLPQDYVMGGETAVKGKFRTNDWSGFLPTYEKQYAPTFDTLSCTSFSFNNVVESQLNFMKQNGDIPADNLKWLTDNGYLDTNGRFNLSDRFLAIMSGTTMNGNDFRTVAECARTNGLIPEADFPFAGTTWNEYHDKTKISPAMIAKGKEFLKRVNIAWDWLFFDGAAGFHEGSQVLGAITETPVQIGFPTPAHHATMLYGFDAPTSGFKIFDTYEPFLFAGPADNYDPQMGLHIVVSTPAPVVVPSVDTTFHFTKTLVYGAKGSDVVQLQRILINEGCLKAGLDTGNYLGLTQQAVKNFQVKYGITPTGNVGPITMAKLNSIIDGLKKPSYQISVAGQNLIKQFEGCVLHPYQDQTGNWTIGWGNRYINGVAVTRETPTLTQTQADQLFLDSLGSYQECVNKSVDRGITQNQYDALVSLCYNIGTGAFASSLLLAHVNAGTVTRQDFLDWVKSRDVKTGQLVVLPALVTRRNKEATYYGLA